MAHDPAQVLDKARQHRAEETLLRSGKRGPLPEGDLKGKAPHEIATSVLMVGEEEPADEDDADAMLTREVQEEEGDETDQAIPEDEQRTRPQLTRAQRLITVRRACVETHRRGICTRPSTFLEWVQPVMTQNLIF